MNYIENLKKKHYGRALHILLAKYTKDNRVPKSILNNYGLEAMEEELEATDKEDLDKATKLAEEADIGDIYDGVGSYDTDDEDKYYDEDEKDNEDIENPLDKAVEDDIDGSTLDDLPETSFNPSSMEDPRNAKSLMDILSHDLNEFRKAFTSSYDSHYKDYIDYEGNFRSSKLYMELIDPAYGQLVLIYKKDSEYIKTLDALLTLLSDKANMVSIAGDTQEPFIYEALQIMVVEYITCLMIAFPLTISKTVDANEGLKSLAFKGFEGIQEMVCDILTISPLFGSKIKFEKAEMDEMTGTNMKIIQTPYADSEIVNNLRIGTESFNAMFRFDKRFNYACESIQNILSIRNNGALPEFLIVIKVLSIATRMANTVNFIEILRETSEMTRDLLQYIGVDNENLDDIIREIEDKCRVNMMSIQNSYMNILKEESDKDLTNATN